MKQMPLTKYCALAFLGCMVLAAGILTGYRIGHTSLGQYLPRLLAVGTLAAFLSAVYTAFRHPNLSTKVAGNNAFILACLFICAASLGSSISATAFWQLSPWDRMAGFIPYSDASDYYQQVLAWPMPTFDAWNSRRPLNATLNIMEFHLGGSTLLGMILLRVALATLGITAFIVALASVAGRAAALTAGFVLLVWSWPYVSAMQSEINGITFSAAGYALLLVALTQKQLIPAAMGLFALVLAYTFRPYNPLMPALFAFFVVLGLATDWRKGLKIAVLAAVATTLLVVVVPKTLHLVYGHPYGSLNANTGSTLLGLARGTGWKEASEFVESQSPGLSEKQTSALMYEMAIDAARKDLRPMTKALMVNLAKAIFQSQQEMGSALGFLKQLVGTAQNTPGEFIRFVTQRPSIWTTSLFVLLSVILIFRLLKSCMPVSMLGVVSVAAFISIAPIVFGDGTWRVAATLFPGLALLVAAIPLSIRMARRTPTITCTRPPSHLLKAPSRPRFERYVPIALIGFVLIAMPYPAVSRLFASAAKPLADALILDVRDNAAPHWTGLNRAMVAPRELLTWSIKEGHKELAAFLSKYGQAVWQVRFEQGIFVLMANPVADIQAQSALSDDSGFQLRIVQQ